MRWEQCDTWHVELAFWRRLSIVILPSSTWAIAPSVIILFFYYICKYDLNLKIYIGQSYSGSILLHNLSCQPTRMRVVVNSKIISVNADGWEREKMQICFVVVIDWLNIVWRYQRMDRRHCDSISNRSLSTLIIATRSVSLSFSLF